MPAVATPLPELLRRVFGHEAFRAHQQPVCEAAASGRDVLLVMPTGAGKSLCYQLPALARGGTALVISPLIALMDDQAAKLSALKLRVARIHSGLSRDAARQACRDYLEGSLDFLFIAPERLRVPGFPEMLARRKPALVAIDEAHCISQWGHDFRPDYRTLGQFLPALRPAPIIALTATATPTVQKDILRALDLDDPAVFITGFRRANLQIEVTELSKPQRTAFIARLLAAPEARPAIVYAASRKSAGELASALNDKFTAAAYHAGLDAGTRERVQRGFLSGKLDVVVATVAFGMGVDKADVRTVVHAALPGSVEGYYQEIGRAGRDGLPSRAVLLHGFADRKMHDFFIERDYPPVSDLVRVASALRNDPANVDQLQQALKMEQETVERSIDKLLAQGAVTADVDGTIRSTGQHAWQDDYAAQVRHRREQVDRMVAFTEDTGCRMTALIRHFGDLSDGSRRCGLCDCCRPENSASAPSHAPSAEEKEDLRAILNMLSDRGKSVGKVFEAVGWSNRPKFEVFLEALVRAGLAALAKDSFRAEDGRDVSFRKASATPEGRDANDAALETVWLRQAPSHTATKRQDRKKSRAGGPQPVKGDEAPLGERESALLQQLKAWRVEKARQSGTPSFIIFQDSVLRSIASERPGNVASLSALRGIGPEKLDRFGAEILALCRGEATGNQIASAAPAASSRTAAPNQARENWPDTDAKQNEAQCRPRLTLATKQAMASEMPNVPVSNPDQQALEDRLREWRRKQAADAGLPTFFVLSETALRKVAATNPQSLDQLRSVPEVGPDKLARYGADVLALCRSNPQ